VYVLVPAQLSAVGLSVTVGVPGVIVLPQLSVTVGNVVGAVASAIHDTVLAPSAGTLNVGALIVYTYFHVLLAPLQSV
jgi:hypothetical protein